MAIIDPIGYFKGKRLRRCSPKARLFWLPIYLRSNGYARTELDFESIADDLASFRELAPTVQELETWFKEYTTNNLCFVYACRDQRWAQFDTRRSFTKDFKTADDKRSPAPPEPEYTRWLRELHGDDWPQYHWNKDLPNYSETLGKDSGKSPLRVEQDLPLGVGVGVGSGLGSGVGKGVGEGGGGGVQCVETANSNCDTSQKTCPPSLEPNTEELKTEDQGHEAVVPPPNWNGEPDEITRKRFLGKAVALLDRCGIHPKHSIANACGDSIRYLSRENGLSPDDAEAEMERRVMKAKEMAGSLSVKWDFWFGDGDWREQVPKVKSNNPQGTPRFSAAAEKLRLIAGNA